MKKNELIKTQEKIYRVLDVSENEILIIDCLKLTMPQWVEAESIPDAKTITDEELCSLTDCHIPNIDAFIKYPFRTLIRQKQSFLKARKEHYYGRLHSNVFFA